MIKELSIIFPLYNEEKRLKNTFTEIIKFKKRLKKRKIEIIFIDDGSDDKSKILIDKFIVKSESQNFKIKNFKLKKNMGKGYALKEGVRKSSKKWTLTTDIDLSVPLSQIFIWEKNKLFKDKKIIFGSRNLKNSKVEKNFIRYILGKIFNFFVKTILNISLFDTQCGFKVYQTRIAKKLFSKLTHYGFTHDLELVLILKNMKIPIIELPVKWTHKAGSKVSIFIDPLRMFINILYLRFKYFL
ncbi:glycosyltransferase [Candidatus Pelagibacter bacterium]|nr:glycosyltransferase [Candidatus Pelagibacter bacterium]